MARVLTSPGSRGLREHPESALWSTVRRSSKSEAGAQLQKVCVAPHGPTANTAESSLSTNQAKVCFPSGTGFPGLSAGRSLLPTHMRHPEQSPWL